MAENTDDHRVDQGSIQRRNNGDPQYEGQSQVEYSPDNQFDDMDDLNMNDDDLGEDDDNVSRVDEEDDELDDEDNN